MPRSFNYTRKTPCRLCDGTEWVCERHPDRPWEGTESPRACDCGAPGDPCPACNSLANPEQRDAAASATKKIRLFQAYGTRQIHFYEEMTPEKRPQDVGRNGSTLKFVTLEHHGTDVCPEAIEVIDAVGRRATYVVTLSYTGRDKRARDIPMDGSQLRFETLDHGGEYPDDMPQLIRATDQEGRSSRYKPLSEGGKVVDSKGFTVEPLA